MIEYTIRAVGLLAATGVINDTELGDASR